MVALSHPLVSIILPIYNAEEWIDACLQSIVAQTYDGIIELCVYNDACTDMSMLKVKKYADQFMKHKIHLLITQCKDTNHIQPKGKLNFLIF